MIYSTSSYNLNHIREVKNTSNAKKIQQSDQTIQSDILVYFENLETKLIEHISNCAYVMGCVAWLTNKNIIAALEKSKGVKIIVNKEEFLSSKMEKSKLNFYKNLRGKYDNIKNMFEDKTVLSSDIFNNYFNCVEGVKKDRNSILTFGIVNCCSKLHHKFLIFFDENVNPIGVWSGSYNLSSNSNYSLENALYITDQQIILKYIDEFRCIYQHSESYDWKSGTIKLKLT